MSDRTVAIFFSNPNNPTGHWLNFDELSDLSCHVERLGSRCLIVVDETFCDVGPQPGTTAAVVDRRIITIGSLSKSCGLASLRCGWVTTDPGMVPGFVEDAVLFQNIGCKIAEVLGSMALDQIDAFRQAAQQHVDRNRALVYAWLKNMTDAALIEPQTVPSGCVMFPRLRYPGSTAELVERLEERFGVLVAPGRFFGDAYENHIRVGFGGNYDNLKSGLSRLADGLAALRRNAL
jgi:aspartate/methionine/tyrosine aminotransferase